MARGAMLKALLLRHGFWWIFALTIIVMLLLAIGIFEDARFIVVGLMAVCVVAPMLAIMLYAVYGLSPATTFNTTLHDFTIDADKLEVGIFFTDKEETDTVLLRRVGIPLSDVVVSEVSEGGVWVRVNSKSSGGYLFLPRFIFSSQGDYDACIKIVSSPSAIISLHN